MVRNSLEFVPWKDHKEVADDLKLIYSANTEELALDNLDEFARKWDAKYPAIRKSWYNRCDQLNTLFGYTKDIRKAIYTTNAIESLNMTLRKVVKMSDHFLMIPLYLRLYIWQSREYS